MPTPIRIIFNRFPIIVYEDNDLPQGTLTSRSSHTLYIFTAPGQTLSPNPACLKWQLYLSIQDISFTTLESNNHASPAGSLPFLLPAVKSRRDPPPQPISASKIQRWTESQGAKEEETDLRLEAYTSLVDQNVRNAWLYHMYLCPGNFEACAKRLYVDTASSNWLVQTTLSHQLRGAAEDQLSRSWKSIDADEIYAQAAAAFSALETLLGDSDFFSGTDKPGLFDASLVAFTHLILEFAQPSKQIGLQWKDRTLSEILMRYEGLILHRDRVIALVDKIGTK